MAAFKRGADTFLFMAGILLVVLPSIYVVTALTHKIGIPSPAQLAGAAGPQS